jgi:hypothetical protein
VSSTEDAKGRGLEEDTKDSSALESVGKGGEEPGGEEGDGAGTSEKEAAEIAGDAALEAEAALSADSTVGEEADSAAAAEQIEAAAAAAAAALPDHLRLLFERPYLKNLIVDVWSATTSAVETVAAAAAAATAIGADVATSFAAAFVGNSLSEQEQQQALINIAAHGGSAEAAAEVQAPPIPDIYFRPLHEGDEAALPTSEEAKKRAARHLTEALGEQQRHEDELKLQQLEEQLEAAVASVRALSATPARHDMKQQHGARQLKRHMWTGGGGRRGMISIAPKQETVTAAVQAWLSANATTPSSGKEAALGVALASAGVQMDRLTSEADEVLLRHLVEQGLGEVPLGQARRPRIFVYDMPSR